MSLKENLSVVRRIVDSTNLPVNADLESGYSDSVEGAVVAAQAALDIGVAGINLEDSTGVEEKPFFEIEEAVERIKAVSRGLGRAPGSLAKGQPIPPP